MRHERRLQSFRLRRDVSTEERVHVLKSLGPGCIRPSWHYRRECKAMRLTWIRDHLDGLADSFQLGNQHRRVEIVDGKRRREIPLDDEDWRLNSCNLRPRRSLMLVGVVPLEILEQRRGI